MNMKKIAAIFLTLLISATYLNAQKFDASIEVKYGDIKNYQKKYRLVVEIIEANTKAVTKLTKMKNDEPNALKNYYEFIESYNTNIKKALDKYWKFTDTIIYLDAKGIQRLKDSRERNVLVLSPIELGGTDDFITRVEGTAIQLVFRKINKDINEADYKIMMPYSHTRLAAANPLIDYMFVMNMTVRNLNYILESKRTSDFFDYMETEAMKNCKKQEKKKLLIDEQLVARNADSKGMKKYYKRKKLKVIKARDRDELENTIMNGSAEDAYMVLIPFSTFVNPFGREQKTYVLCYKTIVDAENGTILNFTEGKVKASPQVSLVQEKDFKYLNDCEF